jgi:hypothetical protein
LHPTPLERISPRQARKPMCLTRYFIRTNPFVLRR